MGRIINQAVNGVLVGDQRKDQVLLLQDRDGDGLASQPDETTVFFDATNASGLIDPTSNVFAVHQANDKSVYIGDGSADAIIRLVDENGDGDAQDTGEASIWFSADNAAGLSTVTPNGIAEGADGAIYVSNAGTGSAPQDAIYRTVDLNDDGDANDAGEATVWLDVQTVIDTAVPFDLNFVGDVAYLNDLAGSGTDVIYRIEDANGDGSIQRDEVINFISDDMNFGAPVDISSAVAVDGSLYTVTWFPEADENLKVYKLNDYDGSGQIDQVFEAAEVWNGNFMPDGNAAEIGFSIATDADGGLILTGNNFDGVGNVIKLTNQNGDNDFFDAGETTVFGSSLYNDQLERPRAVEEYEGTAQIVPSTVGAGNHFSVFLADGVLYSSGENVVSQLGNGTTGFDIKAPLAVELPAGFDSTIISVSAGMLHTTFLTDDGDVYSFGFNNRGPLGLGDEESRTSAVKIDTLDDVEIVGIDNGNGVSYALAADGTLYAWGSNTVGQLGTGDQEERLIPTAIDALADETIVAVSSGTSHTLALTDDGQVYAFGSNTDNQVSGSDDRRVIEPTFVEGLPNDIVAVTADDKTSYAITSDGRVFGWGKSDKGQLLQGAENGDGTFVPDGADVVAPIELTALPDGIIDIKGGARWAVALTGDGDVYAWGPNDEGPTGGLDGDPALESDVSFLPTKIVELDAVNIVEIQTGPNSIIAVSDTGEVYTWGSNSDGRLGFASDGSVYMPTLVDFEADPVPFLTSATPSDNERDVVNDSAITLTFTESVEAGQGTITLVNRDTAERAEIDIADTRLVQFDGTTVVVTPPSHLLTDARYAIEIEAGTFLDVDGNTFEGIEAGDTSTFNFVTSEDAVASQDRYRGTSEDDLLRGGADDDRINGRDGDDIISGANGDDRLSGSGGDDILYGNAGNDGLRGGIGDDQIYGGDGNDFINGGAGNDVIRGGADTDVIRGAKGDDLIEGEGGSDNIRGGAGNDTVSGGEGSDRIFGNDGDDVLSGDDGNDVIRGGRGNDRATGGDGDDDVFGNDGNDRLAGNDGDDRLLGGSGNDIVSGGAGDDRLIGNDGNDRLEGGDGNDILKGGSGADVFLFDTSDGRDVITDFNAAQDTIRLADDTAYSFTYNSQSGNTVLTYGDTRVVLKDAFLNPDSITNDTTDLVRLQGSQAGDFTGYSVSDAGDVDGDGRDDILVGAFSADPDGKASAGQTYLVFGAALEASVEVFGVGNVDLGALAVGQGVRIAGADARDLSGLSVSSAGDVDGDGLSDILVSSHFATRDNLPLAGEVSVLFGSALTEAGLGDGSGSLDLGTLTPDQGVTVRGATGLTWTGWSVSEAGDIDGDGLADIVIGAQGANAFTGQSTIVFGSTINAAVDGVVDLADPIIGDSFVFKGIDANDFSGFQVASAGDVDGDGIDDVLIGAYGADRGEDQFVGETHLIYGSAIAIAAQTDTQMNLADLTADQGILITGFDANDNSGRSVAGAGDVDGDGYADVLINAWSADPFGKSRAGETYLLFGDELTQANDANDGAFDIANLTPERGIVITGAAADDFTGWSVSGAGDVTGDGLDDILLGAYGGEPGGLVYMISGAALVEAQLSDGVLDLANLTPDQGVIINGITSGDDIGFQVSSAGDIDGDALYDIIIGAPFVDRGDGAGNTGEAYAITAAALNDAMLYDGHIDLGGTGWI